MDKKAIARALKTKATQAPMTQGAPSGVTGMGALASYGAWNYGMSQANQLPRPADVFMSGAFSPLNPIQPVGIDQPNTESGRPMPRRMQYPVGWNMPVGQPGTEGLKLVSFANLRMYADSYSVVRACIQVRKEEILGLDWDIVPTDTAQRDMRGDPDAHDEFQKRRQEALQFFRRPDPNYHDFTGWMGAVLEDVLVVDALSVYLHPSRVPGKGLLGSDLSALEVLDGTTIRPLLDIRGGSPKPPSPAYQQYLWGVPRTDLMDIIMAADIEEMDEPVAEYRGDQLLYLPYTRRSWTPYGFPGIERAIIPVMTGLRRQQYQLEYFSEGSIPGKFIIPGEDISTPAQIRQLQDTLNAIAGDQAWKHKIIVLPRGSKTEDQKQIELASSFDEQLVSNICMAYDVMPMELGIMQGSQGQSPNQTNMVAAASEEINKRKALKPMLQWLKSAIFDHILQDICNQEDMQWAWVGLESVDDQEAQAANFKTLTGIGLLSIDEARVQMGLSPWGLPLTSDPVYMSATGVSTLGTVDPATAEAYFNEPPIVQNAAAATATQPAGEPVVAGTGGSPAQQPVASVGTPNQAGTPGTTAENNAPVVQPPTQGTSTPLHGNPKKKDKAVEKAISSEFDALRRHLKKGRSIDVWKPEFISDEAFITVASLVKNGTPTANALARGKSVMKASSRVSRRNAAMNDAATNVVSTLGDLASNIRNAKVGPINFVDNGTQALHNGYMQVMQAGALHASQDLPNVSPVVVGGFADIAAQRAADQSGFLTGMAQDVLSGQSPAQLDQRINLYSRSLLPAYEQGYGLAALSGQAIGNETTVDDFAGDFVPPIDDSGVSQDNGLTALEVLGGLAAVAAVTIGILDDNGNAVDDGTPDDSVGDPTLDDSAPTYSEPPPDAIIWHATSAEACDLCAERDGRVYTQDTLPCWPGDGGFGEYCDGAANCNCYLEYVAASTLSDDQLSDWSVAGNPFNEITSGGSGFYAQRAAEENYYDDQNAAIRAADIAAVAQDSPEAAARMAARDELYGVTGTRYGPDGRYDPADPRYEASFESELHKAGNAEALIDWYNSGADGQINWGEPGDFDACVAIAGDYLDDPEGFCNLRHQDAVGGRPGSEDVTKGDVAGHAFHGNQWSDAISGSNLDSSDGKTVSLGRLKAGDHVVYQNTIHEYIGRQGGKHWARPIHVGGDTGELISLGQTSVGPLSDRSGIFCVNPDAVDREKRTQEANKAEKVGDDLSKYSPDQARDSDGRFASGSGSNAAAGLTPQRIGEAIDEARQGGFTLDPRNGHTPTTGFQVGGHAEPLRIAIDSTPEEIAHKMQQFLEDNKELYKDNPKMYLGGWIQPAGNGREDHLCIEPSLNVSSKQDAFDLGKQLNQISIWDVKNFEEHNTGGTGEFVGR